MSPLVTSLMLLMVMVINTKAAPNLETDTNGFAFEDNDSNDLLDHPDETEPRPGMLTRPNGQRLSGNERANRYSFDDMDMDMGSADGTFDNNDWRDGRK